MGNRWLPNRSSVFYSSRPSSAVLANYLLGPPIFWSYPQNGATWDTCSPHQSMPGCRLDRGKDTCVSLASFQVWPSVQSRLKMCRLDDWEHRILCHSIKPRFTHYAAKANAIAEHAHCGQWLTLPEGGRITLWSVTILLPWKSTRKVRKRDGNGGEAGVCYTLFLSTETQLSPSPTSTKAVVKILVVWLDINPNTVDKDG